jgi:disulfide bond formation protein DsbB
MNQRRNFLLGTLLNHPRRVFGLIALICLAMLVFGIGYLQWVVGLEPCPMCIVQRYCLILVGVFSLFAALCKRPLGWRAWGLLGVLIGAFGAVTAARQSWLQWNPPPVMTCGRDLYGMIESFPLQRAIPMIFKGSGDCSAVDWTLLGGNTKMSADQVAKMGAWDWISLGGSIANWSFVWFVIFILVILVTLLRRGGSRVA